MKLRTILLFGAPGCGKGTQGKVLGELPGFFHCSCGEVFRSLKVDTELGRIFVEYSSRGQLVPDEPTIQLWREFIQSMERAGRFDPGRDTLLLDGIPRNVRQARLLEGTIEVVGVVSLVCLEPDRLVHRLQRRAIKENRMDDANLEVIRQRLATYEEESRPVLEHYGPARRHDVDALRSPLQVLHDVVEVLLRLPGR